MIWALAAAVASPFFFSLGAALQQHEAMRSPAHGLMDPRLLAHLLRRRWWVAGIVGLCLGGALRVLSLSSAPITIVQPIGVTSLLFAIPLAAMLHGRRPGASELLGALAVIAGLTGLILLVPASSAEPRLSDAGGLGLVGVAGIAVALLVAAAHRLRGALRAILLGAGAAVVYGIAATLVRALAYSFAVEGAGALLEWYILVVPVLPVCGVLLLQNAYKTGHFSAGFATMAVLDPLTAVVAGALALGEPLPHGPVAAAVGAAAGLLIIAGTITLARSPIHLGPGAKTPDAAADSDSSAREPTSISQ